MGLHFQLRCLTALVVSFSILSAQAKACGLRMDKPHAHFDGADEQGHVLFAETLGNLDLGENLTLPIYAVFQSNWQSSSPYLGQGWMLPLLESKIVQIDSSTALVPTIDKPDHRSSPGNQ